MEHLALSTCWNSHRHLDGEAMLEEIRSLGFEDAELSHGVRLELWPGVVSACEKKIIRIRSLHNFCPVPSGVLRPSPNCYEFTDWRPALRHAAVESTLETIRQAAALGAPLVVFHLGTAGPRGLTRKLESMHQEGRFLDRSFVRAKISAVRWRQKNWDEIWERVHWCLEPIVELAQKEGVRLGVEIREKFEEFPHEEEMPKVLEAFPKEVVGYWHDFGHAARKEILGWHTHAETLARWRDRLLGCHIHDCAPPDEDHLPLGQGEIDFKKLRPLLPPGILHVLELHPETTVPEIEESVRLWKNFV